MRRSLNLVRDAQWGGLLLFAFSAFVLKFHGGIHWVACLCYIGMAWAVLVVVVATIISYMWGGPTVPEHWCPICHVDLREKKCSCRVCVTPGCNNMLAAGYPNGMCPDCLSETCQHGKKRGSCTLCNHTNLESERGSLFGPGKKTGSQASPKA